MTRRLFAACLIFVAVAIGIGRVWGTDPALSPFDAYAAYMPGRAIPASMPCTFNYYHTGDGNMFYCYVDAPDNLIRWISVTGQGGVITRTYFSTGSLRVGNLYEAFGLPTRVRDGRHVRFLDWAGVAAGASGRGVGLRADVRYVVFTSSWVSAIRRNR